MPLPAVVLDCGTGYTKMGFAGNVEVCYLFMAAMTMLADLAAECLKSCYKFAAKYDNTNSHWSERLP